MRTTTKVATTAIVVLAAVGGATAAQARPDSGITNDNVTTAGDSVAPDRVDAPLGAKRFAVVDFDGNLVRGKNVVDANPLTGLPGRYEVIFDRDISDCAYVGSIASPGTQDEIPGVIDLATRGTNPNGVFVETSTLDGVEDLRHFHVVVVC